MPPTIDIEDLGLDAGAHLLIKHGLLGVAPGESITVVGNSPDWDGQLSAWCRSQGHPIALSEANGRLQAQVTRGGYDAGRWRGALHTGHADAAQTSAVADKALPAWGLAARGATVEAGSPPMHFRLDQKSEVWSESAADLYAQAVAAQWNPDAVIVAEHYDAVVGKPVRQRIEDTFNKGGMAMLFIAMRFRRALYLMTLSVATFVVCGNCMAINNIAMPPVGREAVHFTGELSQRAGDREGQQDREREQRRAVRGQRR